MKYRMLLLPLVLAACAQTPEATGPASTTTATTTTTAAGATTAATATGAPTANSAAPAPAATAASAPAASGADLLSRYHWQLSNAIDSKGSRIDALFVRPGQPLQLDFNADRMNVVNSCNNLGAGYSIRKGRLQVGPMVSTMMACHDAGLAALDDAISQRLRGSLAVKLLDRDNVPSLQLVTDSGDTLSFIGMPTAETRYGGPGEIAFLEIAPQTVPCNHPLMANQQCLQVRERHFDEQGLASGTPGPWQPLNQTIDGYTHTPGMRNVLRVKRFTVKNAPVDAPTVAYVLDLVVESEKVGP
ncbi:META and DUF4377 domain-containing protein [Paraburkholderia sp. MMS20-SJTR3]|uniref:META and DUF4377 domain-containing protein n=1 Tax=Paraburkholderia sejongensis TaxID=2886946 RepID=A0ABS8JSX4_9BURK|nr:META and DUF4377 domain-containing protein [Paraburkholderia sp. MMS20-SJTR3]MCC8393008.1 META and DUF4377 domain-containing protein [Paraburkholderia sp. MMS20-SJTR3]